VIEGQLIGRLKELRADIAEDAMTAPSGDAFAYGRAVGIYAGVSMALGAIEALLDEAKAREREI
jgi:lipid-binding SYLF domain-containing protein